MAPEIFLGTVLILSSLGVILLKQPVHACLSFLVTLLALAGLYLQLSASFIAVMQVLVYAGAILVLFMFVIVLFQDAHREILRYQAQSSPLLLAMSAFVFLGAFFILSYELWGFSAAKNLMPGFGSVQSLGEALYLDFFLPFEAVILLFLVALVGTLYVGKGERLG